mmetsp:Transcript_51279/g.83180  ORF Transcript_51279/g.83180 Transcript_51279/m.83180 type:complete len:347 (+) Transcript_51279:592-1632(+)
MLRVVVEDQALSGFAKGQVPHGHDPEVNHHGESEGPRHNPVEAGRCRVPELRIELRSVVVRNEGRGQRAEEDEGRSTRLPVQHTAVAEARPVTRLDLLVVDASWCVGLVHVANLHEQDHPNLTTDANHGCVREYGQVPLKAEREQDAQRYADEHSLRSAEKALDTKCSQDPGERLANHNGICQTCKDGLEHQNDCHSLRHLRPHDFLATVLVCLLARGVACAAHDAEGIAHERAKEEGDQRTSKQPGATCDAGRQAEHALTHDVLHHVEEHLHFCHSLHFFNGFNRLCRLALQILECECDQKCSNCNTNDNARDHGQPFNLILIMARICDCISLRKARALLLRQLH